LQSGVFLTLGLSQLAVGFALRAPRRGVGWRERGLELALALAALLQVAAVTWPPLCDFLGTTPVSPTDFLLFAGLATVPGVAVALGRHFAAGGHPR
jgi:Ca2+-transporting ATPase